ncbi:hypothetical protein BDY19DRAFT_995898 [Irpex rosettiformis]|uniref:Uncharacterized protein n=1 Tax=Irpex rosettiformis TaxID=378272 RepID=A0ACB8TW60_9APHY|nr:hypothetical protein BDY19DRAFT_995898 [Irpex rosettiformis]
MTNGAQPVVVLYSTVTLLKLDEPPPLAQLSVEVFAPFLEEPDSADVDRYLENAPPYSDSTRAAPASGVAGALRLASWWSWKVVPIWHLSRRKRLPSGQLFGYFRANIHGPTPDDTCHWELEQPVYPDPTLYYG